MYGSKERRCATPGFSTFICWSSGSPWLDEVIDNVISSVKQTVLVQFFTCDFQIYKKDTWKHQKFWSILPKVPMIPFHNKKIITFTIILKSVFTNLKTFPTILITILKSINSHKNHLKKPQTNNITRINISVVINQINKHKAKIYDNCTCTLIIIKKFIII